MFENIKKVYYALKRTGQLPASITPLNPHSVHPVYSVHANILQPLTRPLGMSKLVHVIGRPHKYLLNSNAYIISEVEGAAGVAPLEFSKNRYDIKNSNLYTDNLIESGKLRTIVYQSDSALKLHSKCASAQMNEISTVITQVPESMIWESQIADNKLKILIVASNPIPKGLFLLPSILKKLNEKGVGLNLKIISSRRFNIEYDGKHNVEFIVTSKMSPKLKSEVFRWADFLLNISPMDTLGTFIDSIKYGVPLITVEGQHASSYVLNGSTGCILNSPLFYYGDRLGVDYFDVKNTFVDFLISQNDDFWLNFIDEIVDLFQTLTPNLINEITQNHKDYCRKEFRINSWLDSYKALYEDAMEKI